MPFCFSVPPTLRESTLESVTHFLNFPHPTLAGTSASGSNVIRNDALVTIEQKDRQSLDACSAVVSLELHAEKRGPCVFPHWKG